MENLFTPTFGSVPPYLAGRDQIVNEILGAMSGNGHDPNLKSILVGARGTGKTTLLSYISERALDYGWITVRVTCFKGMNEEILSKLKKVASEYLESSNTKKIKGVSVGQLFSLEWENEQEDKDITISTKILNILDVLSKMDIGVLFAIDEVKPSVKDMLKFVVDYQTFENKKIALLMAGLPYQVSQLLRNEEVSFLRRAQYKKLERIPDGDVKNAFEKTFLSSGKKIDDDALEYATKEADGFAYMIQLIGYKTYELDPQKIMITLDDVKQGVKEAKRNMQDSIYRTTFYELSQGDLEYLKAMLVDDGVSSTKIIADRINKDKGYASQYRKRLLESGIIRSLRRGQVEFDIPGFKEFLKEEFEEDEY